MVITDLGMPRVNGWQVAERVKTRSPDTAVFLLTGWGEGVTAGEASRFVDHGVLDSDATGLRYAPHFRPRPH